MDVNKYNEIVGELEMFISIATAVSDRLIGTTTTLAHQSYADPVFTKLLCHAISLHRLSPKMRADTTTEL